MKLKISKNIRICILSAIILLILALIFDNQILAFFSGIQTPLVAGLMKIISFMGNFYIIPFIATLVIIIAIKKNKSRCLAAAWTSLLLGVIISFLLKIIIARPRPDLMPTLWDFSFPSWHSLGVFAVLPLLDKKLQPYWLAFAILVSLSRLYLGLHYASDVIGGIIIGYGIGLLGLKFFNLKK